MWKVRERDVELEGEIREGKDVEGIGKGVEGIGKGCGMREGIGKIKERDVEGIGKGCGS